jgi:hypothetical protein
VQATHNAIEEKRRKQKATDKEKSERKKQMSKLAKDKKKSSDKTSERKQKVGFRVRITCMCGPDVVRGAPAQWTLHCMWECVIARASLLPRVWAWPCAL